MSYKNKIHFEDCLNGMQCIEDKSVDMILCDLPYGTTENTWDAVIPFAPLWAQYERIIKDNGAIVLTAQTPFDKVLGCSNLKLLRYEWQWIKDIATGFLNAKKMPLKATENVLVFYKKLPVYNPQMRTGFKPYTISHGTTRSKNYAKVDDGKIYTSNSVNGERYPVNYVFFPIDSKERLHPTQKPVALFEYFIKTYTNPGALVLDSCAGSGTTAIAAINTGRDYILFENDDNNFKIADKRIKRRLAAPTLFVP